ncbi:hypothetical protein CF319_g8945, partial [Tilletia indica]
MADEEANLALTHRRRSTANAPSSTEMDFIRRKMTERYPDRVLRLYRSSEFRRRDPRLVSLGFGQVPPGPPRSATPPASTDPHNAAVIEEYFSEDEGGPAPPLALPDWPQPVSASIISDRMDDFRKNTTIELGGTCAVCSRRSFTKDLLFIKAGKPLQRVAARTLEAGLPLLRIDNEHILEREHPQLQFRNPLLSGLALDASGVHLEGDEPYLDICDLCHQHLSKSPPKLPALSLANGNLRGWLPPHLTDITWLEERLCARYLASAYIVRLYDMTAAGAPEGRPRIMKGHACAFPLNTISTAVKLPWAFSDGGPLLSCIVIGPRAPRQEDLRKVFKVRRQKVLDLLHFLRANFLDYPQFPIDEHALSQLPEDDVPELLMRHVLHQEHGNVPSLFEMETTGLDQHPGLTAGDDSEASEGRTFIEHHGLIDLNGVTVPAHHRMGAALANATGTMHPDMIIKHGTEFIKDYNNPALFPGMFPTLFPWGIGGLEDTRQVALGFDRHAAHLLDLADSAFRRHWSYIFVANNIKHRRLIHIGSRYACKARDFEEISRELKSLDVETVRNVAQHLANGGSFRTLSAHEANVHRLLKKCELISTRVPGSKAAMNLARAEIRSYIAEFGIFQLFLTLNPNPLHSPVFQIFYGDGSVKLDIPIPVLPSAHERAARVADDPVSASDYFHFHVQAVFQYLLGWDLTAKRSTPEGGLFGHLAAFYMVKEHTMRGQLHGHILIWLQGGLNPQRLRDRLKADNEFQTRYLRFMDTVIQHHLPDEVVDLTPDSINEQDRQRPRTTTNTTPGCVEPADPNGSAATRNASTTVNPNTSTAHQSRGQAGGPTSRKPRQERPPDPSAPDFDATFIQDHRLLGEEVQRHSHTSTCFKGGRTSCRFLFPHDLCPATHYDEDTNSVSLQVKDPTVNWHNPALLVATRHNHDLKSVQSGRSGVAAASYITSYSTKSEETPFNQVSMIQTVFERMALYGETTDATKTLMTKCVMQFGRERQLHAQQAATYVRDLGDTWQSHTTL